MVLLRISRPRHNKKISELNDSVIFEDVLDAIEVSLPSYNYLAQTESLYSTIDTVKARATGKRLKQKKKLSKFIQHRISA